MNERRARYEAVWRRPAAESRDLYPGLVVWDDRVSGSITVGRTRLPLWCFVWYVVQGGWPAAVEQFEQLLAYEQQFGFGPEQYAAFLHDLLEMRGEFARLLLVLADAERLERGRGNDVPWWEHGPSRKRALAQLRRCVAALEQIGREEEAG